MNKTWPEKFQRFIQSNILLYCVVLLLILKIITVGASINFPHNIFFADITKLALENFANQTRKAGGLNALVENQKLDEAAQLKAQDMVKNNYFAHTSPSGITPWNWFLQAGYNYKYAGENLAVGFFDSNEVYQAWLNSPSHKANLLNPNYKEVGTAVLGGFANSNTIIVVQLFGAQKPAKSAAPVVKTVATNIKPIAQATPAVSASPKAKVLSQSTESKTVLDSALYNSGGFLQDIIFGLSMVVIGILLLVIFFSFSAPLKGALIFRALILIILLSASLLINKEMIISIIPHQIII